MVEDNADPRVLRGSETGRGPIPETNMKRGITVLLSVGIVATAAYFTVGKWAIRHETITFYDESRDNRPVAVDVAVRRDKEMQANAGMIKLPVAVLNHGNTVKNTGYSFLTNLMAARGYQVISIQHDCRPIRRWSPRSASSMSGVWRRSSVASSISALPSSK
jgi:hypothetical protein